MPDSLITKRALASSLKELMKTQPLTKISVGDICEKCGMNRKSFYYHFCDKYDLVNWIFDTEFSEIRNRPDHITKFEEICEYFYADREFYRNALQITGQNSFRDYFRMQIQPVLKELVGNLFDSEEDTEFLVTFLADGMVSALIRGRRWRAESDVPWWRYPRQSLQHTRKKKARQEKNKYKKSASSWRCIGQRTSAADKLAADVYLYMNGKINPNCQSRVP